MLHLCLLLHIVAGAVAAHAHHVIDVDDVLHQVRILIDHCDLVLDRQVACQGNAHLSRAHNDNPHAVSRPFFHRHQGPNAPV